MDEDDNVDEDDGTLDKPVISGKRRQIDISVCTPILVIAKSYGTLNQDGEGRHSGTSSPIRKRSRRSIVLRSSSNEPEEENSMSSLQRGGRSLIFPVATRAEPMSRTGRIVSYYCGLKAMRY